jgi:hypothetical protein
MDLLRLGVLSTSSKENEFRRPIHPLHVDRIDADVRARIVLEHGYGERYGVTDAHLAGQVHALAARRRGSGDDPGLDRHAAHPHRAGGDGALDAVVGVRGARVPPDTVWCATPRSCPSGPRVAGRGPQAPLGSARRTSSTTRADRAAASSTARWKSAPASGPHRSETARTETNGTPRR